MRRLAPAAALLAVAAAPAAVRAQQPDSKIAAAVDRVAPKAIETRHVIHQNPELGNREVKTAELIAKQLRELGLEVQTNVAMTGVVATLKGGRPGPLVAVRADMDALPVTEATDLPFKSTARATYNGREVGVMHACGHDVHVAVQLGVAQVLASMKDQVPGTVQFIFQPAEEGAPEGEKGGAALMLEEGIWKERRPSAVFGLHVAADMEVGTVAIASGPAMAATAEFTAVLKGRQSHGGYPQLGIDPVVMASQAVLALQTIRSRNLSPFSANVVTVGQIHGGNRNNIIPDEVMINGTVRTFTDEDQAAIEKRMREILDGVSRAAGGSFTLDFKRGYPVTVNDTLLVARMAPTLVRAAGQANVKARGPVTGGEDFSYFARTVPGYFFNLGSAKPGVGSGDHHTPTFRADDAAVPVGMRVMASLLLEYMKSAPAKVATR